MSVTESALVGIYLRGWTPRSRAWPPNGAARSSRGSLSTSRTPGSSWDLASKKVTRRSGPSSASSETPK